MLGQFEEKLLCGFMRSLNWFKFVLEVSHLFRMNRPTLSLSLSLSKRSLFLSKAKSTVENSNAGYEWVLSVGVQT